MIYQTTIGDGYAIVEVVYEFRDYKYDNPPYRIVYPDMIQITDVMYKNVDIYDALTEDQFEQLEMEICEKLNDRD